MKFNYTLIQDKFLPGKKTYLALLDINLGENKLPVKCLIDSGSPISIIHSPLAVAAGVTPIDGKKGILLGIGGEPIKGYFHKITFSIYGSNPTLCTVFLTAELKVPYCLLGQIGFFENYKVVFNLRKKFFEILPA